MNLKLQSTPNPHARKYILDQDVKSSGKISYQNPLQCNHVPLAYSIMLIDGVTQVHLFENVITVSQNGSINWPEIDKDVQDVLIETLANHDPDFIESADNPINEKIYLDENVKEVEQILDMTIRPSLQLDGGDVEVLEVNQENNTVTIKYLGACGGCPSAYEGTLYAMEQVLSDHLNKQIQITVV